MCQPAYLGCGRSHVLLGEAAELFKSYGVLDRHVRQDFAIQQHIRFLEGIDEPAVVESLSLYTGCNAKQRDGKSFLVAASAVAIQHWRDCRHTVKALNR